MPLWVMLVDDWWGDDWWKDEVEEADEDMDDEEASWFANMIYD
jgi:hypothetical protein